MLFRKHMARGETQKRASFSRSTDLPVVKSLSTKELEIAVVKSASFCELGVLLELSVSWFS